MIYTNMAKKGYSEKQISQALSETSPELPTRKAGHEQDYIKRTVSKAISHPEVTKIRERQRQQERSLSLSR